MAFQFKGRTISKIGVIGSGQIGPDIALYFTKVFHPFDVPVVVVDVVDEALKKGQAKLEKKIDRGAQSGAFSDSMAAAMKAGVTFTSNYDQLRGADFIVEAATEDVGLKRKIFGQLEKLCADKAIFASNSSHLEPEVIFEPIADRGRTMVIHYFFPAERNPMVEIVKGQDTDPEIADWVMALYERIGKVPIRVGSRYGYAVDPIFEGLFLASALAVEEGLGTVKEVDAVGTRALGLTVGSFTAMNLTGGNPITNHGLDVSHEKLNAWYRSPELMKKAMESGQPWEVAARGEKVELPEPREKRISDALRGAYFGVVGQIIDSGISNVSDLEMALEVALDIDPPFAMMNDMGVTNALELVRAYARIHPEFPVPACLVKQVESGKPWPVEHVLRHDVGDVAVLRIRRPKVLNALNNVVFGQLEQHIQAIRDDDQVKGAVLTGFGIKAFVSGADIHFLAEIKDAAGGFETTQESKKAGNLIESLKKPVVCAMNGLAMGGGIELAMCCKAILCKKGLKVAAAQPEVNLGIIPGAGGTQRLPRWIGIKKAAELLRTGKPISSEQGVELGLFYREVDGDELIDTAVQLVRDAAAGKVTLRRISPEPVNVPDQLPEVNIGHLSQAIDQILCRAILEGCRKPLSEGLRFESEMFGQCATTEDMRIGVQNFIQNGPRAKAPFVHR